MARVTVEDCVEKIPNRFNLVMTAAQRARNVASGAELTVERDDDKNPVVALREIAEERVDFHELEDALITGLQRYVEVEEPEEDEMDLQAIQNEISSEAAEEMATVQASVQQVVETPEEIHEEVVQETAETQAGVQLDEEVAEDVLTVHDVAAEEVEAAEKDSEILHEGGEIEGA